MRLAILIRSMNTCNRLKWFVDCLWILHSTVSSLNPNVRLHWTHVSQHNATKLSLTSCSAENAEKQQQFCWISLHISPRFVCNTTPYLSCNDNSELYPMKIGDNNFFNFSFSSCISLKDSSPRKSSVCYASVF